MSASRLSLCNGLWLGKLPRYAEGGLRRTVSTPGYEIQRDFLGEVALCPQDLTSEDLRHASSLEQLSELFTGALSYGHSLIGSGYGRPLFQSP